MQNLVGHDCDFAFYKDSSAFEQCHSLNCIINESDSCLPVNAFCSKGEKQGGFCNSLEKDGGSWGDEGAADVVKCLP